MDKPYPVTRIEELAHKLDQGTSTEEEQAEFNEWYNSFTDQELRLHEGEAASPLAIRDRMHDALLARLKERSVQVRLWPRIAIAAAAMAAITLGIWIYLNEIASSRIASRNDEIVQNGIAPGRNTATLTLANGEVINLDTNKTNVKVDGSLVYNDQSEIASIPRNDGKVQTLTAATPRGGTYQVTLPDGTKAWLNAASSIRFPSSFAGTKQRRIEMTGEVYLEVAKDQKHPFIVESKGQQVKVLGTHFNVNAYIDEGSVKTTLLEGSVNVNGTILIPNQQAVLKGSAIQVKTVDPSSAIAWKNGEFVFNEEPLQNIMRMVARWYDVEVVYENIDKNKPFGGSVSRFENISKVLEKLELTGSVHFKIEGRRVTVSK